MKTKKTTRIYSALTLIIASLIFLFSYSSCSSNDGTKETTKDKSSMVSEMPMAENKSYDLKIEMNKLWEDHVTWTRNVILCLVDGLPGADQAVKRLMQNQVDIGNGVKPYYGDDAGNKLT
jgi:hypothetical protein